MRKNKLLVLFAALILICTLSIISVTFAGDEDCFVEVDLELNAPSIFGNNIEVIPSIWTSLDGVNWSKIYSEEFSSYCELVYYNQSGDRISVPTDLGSYVAKYKVKDDASVPNRFRNGNKLISGGMVLATFSYDIVYQDFQVKFYPEGNTTYSDGIDYYSKLMNETKPYFGGSPLSINSDYQIEVYKDYRQDDINTPVFDINSPGEYTVIVTINNDIPNSGIKAGQKFSSTFFLTKELNGLAYIDDVRYEGMYCTELAPMENKLEVEGLAIDYYTPSLKGSIASVDATAYEVMYLVENTLSAIPPREAGEYYARIIFKENVDKFDIQVGDFVDIPYQIKKKPYTVDYTYNSSLPDSNGGFLVQANGTKLVLSFKSINSDELSGLAEKTSVRYFKYNSESTELDKYEELSFGEVPTDKGLYRAIFTIDANTTISGKEFFGNADSDYEISSALYNNVWQFDFQIMPTIQIQNLYSLYTYTGNIVAISPDIKYSGATMDSSYYGITFFDKDMNEIGEEGVKENGCYYGVINFIKDWTPFGEVIVNNGDTYLFSFEIVLPQANPSLEEIDGSFVFTVNGKIPEGFSVKYFRYENSICNAVEQDVLLNRVGSYKVVYTFDTDNKHLGIKSGDVITLDFEKKAINKLNDVYFGVKEAYVLDGSFYTDYNSNIFHATLQFDEDAEIDKQIKEKLNYSVYYQREYDNGSLSICGYPLLPGKYRAVLVFNEADNVGYGVNAGDGLSFSFEIKPISVTASFAVTDDLVYSRTEKKFDVTFLANNRPLEVDKSSYTLLSTKLEDGEFTKSMPQNAGTYKLAAVFTDDGFEMYGLVKFMLSDSAYTFEELQDSSLFSGKIVIERLQLTVVVGLPVEEKGMYHLDKTAVNATYEFYKSNGVGISKYSDFEEVLKCGEIERLSEYVASITDFNIKYLCSPLYSISSQEEIVESSVKTSRYKLEIEMKNATDTCLFDNAIIRAVVSYYEGAKEGVSYDSGIYFATRGTDLSFSVGYQVSPLPLIISLPDSLQGELYYGGAKAVGVEKMKFETYNLSSPNLSLSNGELYDRLDLTEYAFYNHFDLKYYNRKSGTDIIDGAALSESGNTSLSSSYIFAAGDYLLSLTVKDTNEELFSFFTLQNGVDEQSVALNGKPISVGDKRNIRFTVNSAKVIRAVFERDFNTFVYDGSPKKYNVVFYYGDTIIDQSEELNYELVYKNSLGLETEPCVKGKYSIVLTFNDDNYKYAIRQLEGEYIQSGQSNAPYILEKDRIEFDYEIIGPINLSWSWNISNEQLNYDSYQVSDANYQSYKFDYDHTRKSLQIRFFDANNTERSVNLIKNSDYAIWYYKVTNDGKTYTRLDEEPYEVGDYIAEIVFLKTQYDYLVKYNGNYNKIPYSYAEALENKDYYGKSLALSQEFFLDLAMEGRFFEYTIKPSKLLISGFTVNDKEFDNTTVADYSLKSTFAILDNGAIIDDDLASVKELLSLNIVAYFESRNVRYEIIDSTFAVLPQKVTFAIHVSDGFEVILPYADMYNDDNANAYILEQLETLMTKASGEDLAKLNEIKTIVERVGEAYNIVIGNLVDGELQVIQGKIIRRVVTIMPDSVERFYDPFFKDVGIFTYSTDMEAMPAGIEAYLKSKFGNDGKLEYLFVGSLSREGQDEKNDVGSYSINLGTLESRDSNFRLVLSTKKAFYKIIPVRITVKVVDSALSKYYDEKDPIFECELEDGILIYGDSIDYSGEYSPIRESIKTVDDVGFYSIDLKPIRIVNGENANVSENYYIQYAHQTFEIKIRNIFVTPKEGKGNYGVDFYSLYSLDSTEKKYSVQYENVGGLIVPYEFQNGDRLYGQFGFEPIAGVESSYKTYRITLGTITVRNSKGKDVSDNYKISQYTTKDITYIINKILVVLSVNESITKVFGEKDPIIPVSLYNGSKLPEGYSIAPDSTAGREKGEDAGVYEILNSNLQGGIKILDSNGNDSTNYFEISVIVGAKTFEITKFKLLVCVNSKTYLKGDNSIRSIVFKDETNKVVSKEIIEGSKLNSCFRINGEFIEGDNTVKPQIVSGSEDRLKNFDFTLVEGVVTLVYPENTVYVSDIESYEQIAVKNKHISYKGVLYETLHMYNVKTGNGQTPTRNVEVTLTVPEELYNKTVYVLAAHPDGSVVKLEAVSNDGTITITDNEFNYIMLCSVETWPYYVIGAGIFLIIVGVLSIVGRAMIRKKLRGGEAKRNFAKEEKREEKEALKRDGGDAVRLSSGIAPTKDAKKEYMDDEDLYASSVKSAEEDKKPKKKKESKRTTDVHAIALGGVTPRSVRPGGVTHDSDSDELGVDIPLERSYPSHTETIIGRDSSADISLADDDIIISTTVRGAESISHSSSTLPSDEDDDDDIIITSTVRRGED